MAQSLAVLPCTTLLAFAHQSIQAQIDIACKVRDLQNDTYILFDSSFVTDHTTRVGDFRVQVDSSGRKAVLSMAAQSQFTLMDYLYFAQQIAPAQIYVVDSIVYLYRHHVTRKPFALLHLHPYAPQLVSTTGSSPVTDSVIRDLTSDLYTCSLCAGAADDCYPTDSDSD